MRVLARTHAHAHTHLKHLSDDRLYRGHKHFLLRGEGSEDMVVLVRSVDLLVRHADAVVRRLRVYHVKVARRLFPAMYIRNKYSLVHAASEQARRKGTTRRYGYTRGNKTNQSIIVCNSFC